MSLYTISLNELLKIRYPETFADVSEKINKGRELLFNFNYIEDEIFKNQFEKTFILTYLERDIAFQDFDYFLFMLQTRIENVIDIYYKEWQVINSVKADMLLKSSITENVEKDIFTSKSTNKSQGSSSSNSKSNSKTKSSQFPQDIIRSDFDNIQYMDSGAQNQSDSKVDNKSQTDSVNDVKNENIKEYSTSVTTDIFERIQKLNNSATDVIQNCVNSFNDLFLLIY